MKANNVIRHSIVSYQNALYMIETNHSKNKCLLIDAESKGVEISNSTEVEVVQYPAQLAFKYLEESTLCKN